MSIDLKKLENKLDEALSNETSETLTKFLTDKKMSNTKQSMKLYTEEQLHSVMLLALGRHGIYVPNKHYQDLIDLLTPIELPSDEEIQNKGECAFKNAGHNIYNHYNTIPSWVEGAKWMRDKIGGNK